VLHAVGLDDQPTFFDYSSLDVTLVVFDRFDLFIFALCGHHDHTDVGILEAFVQRYFLVRLENWFLDFFHEQLDLGIAKLQETSVEVCLGDVCFISQLLNGPLIFCVEKVNDGGLEDIHY
jgi:hypothetical protein